jgi:glutathione S-transferase
VVYERHFHAPAAVNQDWLARCKGQLLGGLKYLEGQLEADWFVGERFSQADLSAAALMGYLKLRLPEAFEQPIAKLQRLSERCEALPSFAAARPSPDEVMPS